MRVRVGGRRGWWLHVISQTALPGGSDRRSFGDFCFSHYCVFPRPRWRAETNTTSTGGGCLMSWGVFVAFRPGWQRRLGANAGSSCSTSAGHRSDRMHCPITNNNGGGFIETEIADVEPAFRQSFARVSRKVQPSFAPVCQGMHGGRNFLFPETDIRDSIFIHLKLPNGIQLSSPGTC